jgi:hypothetical protein
MIFLNFMHQKKQKSFYQSTFFYFKNSAKEKAVTINGGYKMQAWYDIDTNLNIEDIEGINDVNITPYKSQKMK